MKLNSRWSYLLSGVNIAIGFFGALIHSLPLLLMGAIFGFFNWSVANLNRRIEDESIRNEGKSDDSENKE